MRVIITKDYWDGSRSKTAKTDLDGFNMTQLAFLLMEKGVASITITQVENLQYMIDMMQTQTPKDQNP